jgi:Phosphoinositide phospholipase C, Ca2+-dependent
MRERQERRVRFLVVACAGALIAAGSPASAQSCVGDCNDDGSVALGELIVGVGILRGESQTSACAKLDADRDGAVGIHEVVRAVGFSLDGCPYPLDPQLRLNEIQVVGTHNSYHIMPQEPVYSALRMILPNVADVWQYTHPPLDEQFELEGVRQIELDVYADPDGGLYANRGAVGALTGNPASGIPALDLPGFKILHVQDADFESNCYTFHQCLETVKSWSDAHPGHVPIMIQIEAKDDVIPNLGLGFEFVVPIEIGAAEFDALDAEILQVFPLERIITPDEVRGGHETLEDAVLTDGWPTLGRSRGRVLFTLDNGGAKKAAYIEGHPSLRGRILFTSSEPGEPEAAFVKLNDPMGDFDHIREVVAAGFIVRTRADSDTEEARSGDTTHRDLALASGAQFVSTDYPVPDPALGTGYEVQIPMGMPAGCNPISAPAECTPLDVENPQFLAAGK